MAWTYEDWITQTSVAARATRLRLHIAEVADKVDANKEVYARKKQTDPLIKYLEMLFGQLTKLDEAGGDATAMADTPRVRSSFVRVRPV